ncbi:hypothetical protein AAFF_G00086500 [Aldrovandia affinis]|uniref:Uncharacterized protein n=1 Tax=Aldrovandia affinis TaxID=143900 RepID=A0AAD7RWT4_9TELE|nr:hypothetical protein AAFF_G00086500 [Aldrovandia affinis]
MEKEHSLSAVDNSQMLPTGLLGGCDPPFLTITETDQARHDNHGSTLLYLLLRCHSTDTALLFISDSNLQRQLPLIRKNICIGTSTHLQLGHLGSYRQYYKHSVQGYKEALVPYQDSMDGNTLLLRRPLITPRRIVPCKGSYGHSSPVPVYVDPPLCHIICQSFRITMSVEETGNAENPEDLADNMADTDHAPCEEMEKEHSLLAIDHSQTTPSRATRRL